MGPPWLRVLGVMVAVTAVACQQFGKIYGTFRVIPKHLEECPPEMRPARKLYTVNVSAMRDRSKADVWLYSANGTLHVPADDNYTVSGNVASWSQMGGWKDNAYMVEIPKMCSAMKALFPDLWRRVAAGSLEPERIDCPLMPGFYSVSNVATDFNIDFPPTFFYGKWRGTLTVSNTVSKERTACVRAFFDTVPKTGKGKDSPGKKPSDFTKLVLAKLNMSKFNSQGQIQ
ncbi:uncharacterized protein LOC117643860 [Thrips palmi]|uniref:Uncharacterized protein LOC117643860 n=1 Tax=Thrips palmi TaxID=161013 RepID=A0A6P8YPP2_THRPL|nr:uncharacterized protein LOC117643860 [Thrips palmi]